MHCFRILALCALHHLLNQQSSASRVFGGKALAGGELGDACLVVAGGSLPSAFMSLPFFFFSNMMLGVNLYLYLYSTMSVAASKPRIIHNATNSRLNIATGATALLHCNSPFDLAAAHVHQQCLLVSILVFYCENGAKVHMHRAWGQGAL